MVLLQHQEEFHKLKLHLILMKMVLWMLTLLIKHQEKPTKLQLPIIKEDLAKKILKDMFKKLNNSRLRMKQLEKKLMLRMDLKIICTLLEIQWKIKNSKTSSKLKKKQKLNQLWIHWQNGLNQTVMLLLKIWLLNKKS